jgi:ArsR family transcriptional regulator
MEASAGRWELYRALSEPIRLRLLALVAEEELAIGELSELLGESQPNVSRHAASLRQVGLVRVQRQGTRSLLRLQEDLRADAVVLDALHSGQRLCQEDGSLARVNAILAARDAVGREYFARAKQGGLDETLADATSADLRTYLAAVAMLLPARKLAIEVGTGDGRLLDVLAPAFERVVAIDRSDAQAEVARRRVEQRGYRNVDVIVGEARDARAAGLADVVFAVRLLHHAPKPAQLIGELAGLCGDEGALVLLDYAPHEDERMRDQADLWLGFPPVDLKQWALAAGFGEASTFPLAAPPSGPDAHLPWQVLVARRRRAPRREPAKAS